MGIRTEDPTGTIAKPGLDEHEDARLVARLAAGEREVLGCLYDRHAGAVLAVALRILKDRQDAEDLVHDVFVEAWRRAADFDPERGNVRRWLNTRARSRAIDRLRALATARRHGLAASIERDDRVAHPYEQWDASDRERARAALRELPDAQRELVEYSYFEGLTCSEMATRCGIPIGTVKSRLSAAMTKLRRSLAADGRPS